MPANFKAGQKVQQVLPAPFKGTVQKMGQVGDELGFLVVADDGDERWFRESELEAQPAPPEA